MHHRQSVTELLEAIEAAVDLLQCGGAPGGVIAVVDAIAYAHDQGVIHRDLSPRNVMLSRDGDVKLVDCGIAVSLGAARVLQIRNRLELFR